MNRCWGLTPGGATSRCSPLQHGNATSVVASGVDVDSWGHGCGGAEALVGGGGGVMGRNSGRGGRMCWETRLSAEGEHTQAHACTHTLEKCKNHIHTNYQIIDKAYIIQKEKMPRLQSEQLAGSAFESHTKLICKISAG